jgi:hypothetical protein
MLISRSSSIRGLIKLGRSLSPPSAVRQFSVGQIKMDTTTTTTQVVVVRHHEVVKSPEDDRSYRGLVLSNGLKAVLVSDPTTDKSAAALDVHVGSMSDPHELPGLVNTFCLLNIHCFLAIYQTHTFARSGKHILLFNSKRYFYARTHCFCLLNGICLARTGK